nr:PREDICTED: STE20-related kinase adapter protein beta [Lepisosteus oculatus]
MSFLDCSCISHTAVESISVEDRYETHHFLAHESPSCSLPRTVASEEMTVFSSDANHYELLSELGRGFNNLRMVCMARHKPTGKLLALKQTNLDRCTEEELRLLLICLEGGYPFHPALKCYTHPGSLDNLLQTYFTDGMSESLIAYLLHGVLKALDYLHQMGYIHRSVKASHILLSADGRVYLSGLHSLYSMMRDGKRSKFVYEFPQHSSSLLPWLSPELLRQDLHGYDVKSDIYSLGITACELASGRVPFQDMHPTLMLLQKLKGWHCCLLDVAPFPLQGLGLKASRSGVDSGIGESVATSSIMRTMTSERPQSPAPKNHSALLHHLVELCLHQQPEKRPSASTLLTHAFFKQVKRHTNDSFLSLMYPALPLTSTQEMSRTSQTAFQCHSMASRNGQDGVWDFS